MSTKRRHRRQDGDWMPPSELERQAALGQIHGPPALVAATKSCSGRGGDDCRQHSGCFLPKTPPAGSDWLADGQPGEAERGGQSCDAFCRRLETQRSPCPRQRTILLCNVDKQDDSETCRAAMSMLRQFMELYFEMPCEVIEPLSDEERLMLVWRDDSVMPQLQTGPIQGILFHKLQTHYRAMFVNKRMLTPFCIIGVTMVDLYPGKGWNFVFGQAVPTKGVGLFSFARFTEVWQMAWQAKGEKYDTSSSNRHVWSWRDLLEDPRALRRALQTLAHETCHLFHLEHCVFYQCVMNGANHLKEGDESPLHLCPVCFHKLHGVLAKTRIHMNVVRRYRALSAFLLQAIATTGGRSEQQPLESDGVWYGQAATRCQGFLNRNDD